MYPLSVVMCLKERLGTKLFLLTVRPVFSPKQHTIRPAMLTLNLFVLGMHSRDKLSLKSQGSYITSASHMWHTALNVIILYAISLYDWMTRLQC